jgi:RND family efflux transporter MFP subunit
MHVVNTAFKSPINPKIFGALVMAIAALSLSACQGSSKKDDKKDGQATLVDYAIAKTETAPIMISGTGSIGAWQEAPIGAETGGLTATEVLVDEGQYVTKGQALLRMNDSVLRAQFQQAEAGVMSAKAQANEAAKAYGRAKDLFEKGFFSQAALDQREAVHKTALAGVATAEAARSEVGTRLSQATLRAPVNGLITSRTAVTGQIVTPGVELFRIVRDNRIEFNLEVVESELKMLKAGQSATVTGENGETTEGTIRVVTPVVDPKTRLGMARISIAANAGFKPGQFAKASVNVGSQNVVTIPQKSLVYQQNAPYAFVIIDSKKAVARKLTTRERVGDMIVVAEGIAAGEQVVTSGAGFLVDGDKIKIVSKTVKTGGEN